MFYRDKSALWGPDNFVGVNVKGYYSFCFITVYVYLYGVVAFIGAI